MAGRADYRLVVLFDSEIRTAAKLLKEAAALADSSAPNDERAAMAMAAAMHACAIALAGAEDDDSAVIVMAARGRE